jgi:hypothetical protein
MDETSAVDVLGITIVVKAAGGNASNRVHTCARTCKSGTSSNVVTSREKVLSNLRV